MAKEMKEADQLSGDIGEFGLIDQIKRDNPLSKTVIKGIGDDTAVVKGTKTKYTLLTTDMMVESRHFTLDMNPVAIGKKALACNISDIAAMGGKPKYALISLGITDKVATEIIKNIYKGIKQTASEFNIDVVGGDTVFSDKMIINIALYGEVKKENLVTRGGAKAGDLICVTGPLGNSFDSGHHLNFTPKLKDAHHIVKHLRPTAMIDISDGLAADLGHILKASKVGANLYQAEIPLTAGAKLTQALLDGEDFELLFTVPEKRVRKYSYTRLAASGYSLIGEIVPEKNGLKLIDEHGAATPIEMRGFTHF